MDEKKIGLLAAGALLAVNFGHNEWRANKALERDVKELAHIINGAPGDVLSSVPGATVESRVEGDTTLVVMLSNIPGDDTDLEEEDYKKMFEASICKGGAFFDVIDAGGQLRVEVSGRFGSNPVAFQIDHCP